MPAAHEAGEQREVQFGALGGRNGHVHFLTDGIGAAQERCRAGGVGFAANAGENLHRFSEAELIAGILADGQTLSHQGPGRG